MTHKNPPDADKQSETHDANAGARHSMWADLGLSEPEFLDESLAPEVDAGLLRSLIRQELPELAARAVYRRIYSFASWHRAHALLLLDELQRSRTSAPDDHPDLAAG